jgi:hypothetical protein
MEKIISKTAGTSNLGPDTLDKHRPLVDSELDAVAGGGDSGAFRGRYQLRMETANGLLSAQGSASPPPQR